MDRRTVIVATAGHVDHGKTTLLRALTGIDLDTLPEEKARGITIALGFAHLDLDDLRVAFIDVPGHESLVRTMVAGAHGVDAALLVVSAAEGVMPQTREHVAILSLLGVPDGIVALTHRDQVDDDMLAMATADVEDAVRGTSLQGRPIVAVSSVTGEGLDALRAALAGLTPRPRPTHGPFRLPIDRVFVRPGFGAVVTGTTVGGALRDGATVQVLPGGDAARVRGLQVHGEKVAEVGPGVRVAINLAGLDRDDLARGAVITVGELPCASIVDVHYRHVSTEVALADGAPVRLLLGTSERDGHIHFADTHDLLVDGDEITAQLRLDAPLPCGPRDRFVLRRASPATTLGGGEVLDPWASRMPARRREAWGDALRRLRAGDVTVWLDRAGEAGLSRAAWRARTTADAGTTLGDRLFADAIVGRLAAQITASLRAFHDANPLARGAARRELRRSRLANLDAPTFDALLERVADQGAVVLDGPLVRLDGFVVTLSPAHQTLHQALRTDLATAALEGRPLEALLGLHPGVSTEPMLHHLEHEGAVVRVAGLGWVDAAAVVRLRDALCHRFADPVATLTPAAFRDAFGLTRRTTMPWLEWLDARGWTTRGGDARSAGPTLRS